MSAHTLRRLLEAPGIRIVPGGGSPLAIRMIRQAGFEAAYLNGYAVAAHQFGVPDVGLIAFSEIEALARECLATCDLPLIVDCDNGYGDVANVPRTVRRLEAAAVQMEDQTWPKRCGHMDGKSVIDRQSAARKIRAAVDARRDEALVVIARTDARAPLGLDEAIERFHRFKTEGADVLFVGAPQSREEVERIARELPGPLLLNISESGKTPIIARDELANLGFKIAIYPTSARRAAIRSTRDFLAALKQSGDSADWFDRMATLDETNAVLGFDELKAFEQTILAREQSA